MYSLTQESLEHLRDSIYKLQRPETHSHRDTGTAATLHRELLSESDQFEVIESMTLSKIAACYTHRKEQGKGRALYGSSEDLLLQECEGAAGVHSASARPCAPTRVALFSPALSEGHKEAARNAEGRSLAAASPQATNPAAATPLPSFPRGPALSATTGSLLPASSGK